MVSEIHYAMKEFKENNKRLTISLVKKIILMKCYILIRKINFIKVESLIVLSKMSVI